jgi:Uma2 family endonuclease
MVALPIIETMAEARIVAFADDPITFDQFLDLTGDRDAELINGVIVDRTAVYLEHQKLFAWLSSLLSGYVEEVDLGIVLGSRSAVRISLHGGRLPDILFVRRERMVIVEEKAVMGPPDLVVEIISPNDRKSDTVSLEAEYEGIGVPEIWFIDPVRRRVRVVLRAGEAYTVTVMTEGMLQPHAIEGFEIPVSALFEQPKSLPILLQLLNPGRPDPSAGY